jgi:hypothetical protein
MRTPATPDTFALEYGVVVVRVCTVQCPIVKTTVNSPSLRREKQSDMEEHEETGVTSWSYLPINESYMLEGFDPKNVQCTKNSSCCRAHFKHASTTNSSLLAAGRLGQPAACCHVSRRR